MAQKRHAADPQAYPPEVWSGWLHGEHESEHRGSVIHEFGSRAGLAILSNCKVLGEGVDICAVDSVALLDPKGSAVDIVQAIGRALRQKPDEGKLATLVVRWSCPSSFRRSGERLVGVGHLGDEQDAHGGQERLFQLAGHGAVRRVLVGRVRRVLRGRAARLGSLGAPECDGPAPRRRP
ncbi:helicase-related protein [Streptomyces mirabilis]|uniref:helicase-related protein n=1 Tax=Streptomyces mirabilis TaxID=68239 RepID=UPI0037ADB64E